MLVEGVGIMVVAGVQFIESISTWGKLKRE
jgi:hypothetical protein